jgi:AraC family transcriptional regulator, transcriptional activator of pobA
MSMVKQFERIDDYLEAANINVEKKLPDFIVYKFEHLNNDTHANLNQYRNEFFEIALDITQGCSFTIDHFKFPLAERRISYICPQRLQSVTVSPKKLSTYRGFTILFHRGFLNSYIAHLSLHPGYCFLKNTSNPVTQLSDKYLFELTELFERVYYEYTEYGQESREVLQAYTQAIFSKGKQVFLPDLKEAKITREQQIFQEFDQLIQTQFNRFFTVSDVAEKLHITSKHLSESVKKVTGKNALTLLNEQRINHAKALLTQTKMTPSQIAHELNFNHPDYFFTFFKRMTGKTPAEFRNI